MKERLTCRIDETLKEEYYEHINEKYGQKRRKTGSELEKVLKLYLTLEGKEYYHDDPDVVEMLGSLMEKTRCTHTQPKDEDVNIKKEIKEIKERLDKLTQTSQNDVVPRSKQELKRKIQKQKRRSKNVKERREGPMDMFASLFKDEYSDYKQVSWNEIAHLAGKGQGVADKRSIQNRINYLVANGCIEPYAPNVYNVKL